MKRFCALIMLFATVTFFSACKNQSEELELAVCGAYSVPGMMCFDLKGQSQTCEIIEKDSHGRILFSFTAYSSITEKNETAQVICQTIESDTVYFYEDICYLFEPTTQKAIGDLKEINDWNQELNYSKMSTRPINISLDLCLMTANTLNYNLIKEMYCQTNSIEQSQIQEMVLLDVDSTGQELYYLILEKNTGVEKYFLICDLSYNISTHRTSGTLEDLKQLSLFKSGHNWGQEDGSVVS